MAENWIKQLTPEQSQILETLTSPVKIQTFLDSIPYSADDFNRCPLEVMRDRRANCFDGALFAAAALEQTGRPPMILNLFPDPGQDDDHVLAIFRQNGAYGAIAKSNFVGLRYRDPVYLTLRELVMSYFEVYFNPKYAKTLRAYTRTLNLKRFAHLNWEGSMNGVEAIALHLENMPRFQLLSSAMIPGLSLLDERSYTAHNLGTDPAGVFQPHEKMA